MTNALRCSVAAAAFMAIAFAGQVPIAHADMLKFRCKGVSYPKSDESRVEVNQRRDVPTISCTAARRVFRNVVARRPNKGWSCKRSGQRGLRATLVRCRRSGYNLVLVDLTPNLYQRYFSSNEQAGYDYEAALKWSAHRICVLHNQPDGPRTGEMLAVADYYVTLAIKWETLTGQQLPTYSEHQRCQGGPQVTQTQPYTLKYKGFLAVLGEAGIGRAEYADRYHEDHAAYSEFARLYSMERGKALQAVPSAVLVTFSDFLRLMKVKRRPEVLPEPQVQDPPPCMQSNACG